MAVVVAAEEVVHPLMHQAQVVLAEEEQVPLHLAVLQLLERLTLVVAVEVVMTQRKLVEQADQG